MRVYRIERKKYLETTLRGIGAALTTGYRWNSLNTHLVYAAESRALAMLELCVHLDIGMDLPTDRYYVEIDIPDDVEILELRMVDLPENWDAKPPALETQYIGDDFVNSNNAAVLKVPSAILPQEFNYLINPNRPDASRITLVSKTLIAFDSRLKTTPS